MKLRFTQAAKADLLRLREFIATHDPIAAKRHSQRLYLSIRSLGEFPHRGRLLPERQNVRELIVGPYVVRYAALVQELVILRVWHGREYRE